VYEFWRTSRQQMLGRCEIEGQGKGMKMVLEGGKVALFGF
jgi:hypothetical protein